MNVMAPATRKPVRRHRAAPAWWLAGFAAALLLCGCATTGVSRQQTVRMLDHIIAGRQRSAADRALDRSRHPLQTLLFFGIRPDMRVIEVWPGTGWYTAVIAPLLAAHGHYVAAQYPPDPHSRHITHVLQAFRTKLAAHPGLYGNVRITTFSRDHASLSSPDSTDMILTFGGLHEWMAQGWAREALAAMYRALKPGGVLGVVDNRGNPDVPQDPRATNGYVNEAYAIRMIRAAGFTLVATSEVNANPRDTKDYPQGVWTLPPTYRLGRKDHAKYAAIGPSDRFTLKFVKK